MVNFILLTIQRIFKAQKIGMLQLLLSSSPQGFKEGCTLTARRRTTPLFVPRKIGQSYASASLLVDPYQVVSERQVDRGTEKKSCYFQDVRSELKGFEWLPQ